MTDNLVQLRTCPRCGGVYSGHGAVSRADNLTVICPDCGTREALQALVLMRKSRRKFLIQFIVRNLIVDFLKEFLYNNVKYG